MIGAAEAFGPAIGGAIYAVSILLFFDSVIMFSLYKLLRKLKNLNLFDFES